jgi:hypothetical protein
MTRSDSQKNKTGSKRAPRKSTKNNSEQVDLQRRINEARQLVDELHKELQRRKSEVPKEPPRIPLWVYVRDYLRDNAGESSIQEVVEGLLGSGHDLGKFPFRNVKTMIVSRYMEGIFLVVKQPDGTDLVKLLDVPAYSPTRK